MKTTSSLDNSCAKVAGSTGFTLVEMLLVMSFIAIFAAAMAVALKGRRDEHALRAAARDLAAAVSYAAHQARILGTPCRVKFSARCDEYEVEALEPVEQKFVAVAGRAGQRKTLGAGIEIVEFSPAPSRSSAGSETALSFRSDGSGIATQIKLRNRAGDTTLVGVTAVTGQVYVRE